MPMFLRRAAIAVGTLLVIGWAYTTLSLPGSPTTRSRQVHRFSDGTSAAQRQKEVKDAFQFAWDGYSKYCMGWGVTAIDALSTALMFENKGAVEQIMRFIPTVDFTKVKGGTSIQLFEVAIRHFGGMISAWDLLNGPYHSMATDQELRDGLWHQMVRLGDILSCAFATPSGVPRNWLNPTTCSTDDGRTESLAGAGSLILEFSRLSDITGNDTYMKLAQRAEQYLLDPRPADGEPWPGLLGSFVSVADGQFVGSQGSWGSLSDSFYEYLIKGYMYNKDTFSSYLDRWLLAADSTIRYVAKPTYGHGDWLFLPYWEGTRTINAMDSLSWFTGGNFILGGMVTDNQTLIDVGLRIADTAHEIYARTRTGLGGEFVIWTESCDAGWSKQPCTPNNSFALSDTSYKLRPEVIETWYYAYRATEDPKYQDWAWAAFQAITTICRTNSGFSAISDVDAVDGGSMLDMQESFVYAEVFKYIYLIHLEDELAEYHVQDSRSGVYNTWVFNTEAHPFKIGGKPV